MITPAEMKLEKLFFMKHLKKKCCKILHSLHCRNGNA